MPATSPLPELIVTGETDDFHHMVRQHVTPDDVFLEIGCSFGECTKLLGELGCSGVAVDHAADAVAQARDLVAAYPTIQVVQADARDIAAIHDLCPAPSVILVDIGGNEPVEKVSALLRLILKTFQPRLLIVKSMELAELASLIQSYTLPNRPHLLATFEESPAPQHLLALSHSPVMNDRLFALQRLRHVIEQEAVLARIRAMCDDESPTVRRQANHALKIHARRENGG